MNFIHGEVTKDGYFVKGDIKFKLDQKRAKLLKDNGYFGKKVCLGVRPEHSTSDGEMEFTIDLVEHLGSATLFLCHSGEEHVKLKLPGWLDIKAGEKLKAGFDQNLICFFDEETTNRIR